MSGGRDGVKRGSGVEGVSGRRGVERVIDGRRVMVIGEGDEDDWPRVVLLTRANH